MSQENSTSKKTKETREMLALGGLLVVLAGVIYYQFFWESDAPSPATGVASANTATRPAPGPSPTPRAGATPEPIVSQPLAIAQMGTIDTSSSGTGRNIFIYPPPPTPTPVPPPSPTPTPVPPPIGLFSINPSGVIARTGDFTLTAFGEKIPQDAQGFINGRAFPTTFVSATEIKIKVPAEAIRTAGNVGVMIRSQNDARLFSNQASLNVAQPPEPPYKYIGLILRKGGATAVLKSQNDDEIHSVKIGDTIDRKWKIINITPQKIEIEDTNIRVSHSINYSGESGG